jgi:hypothetical protein
VVIVAAGFAYLRPPPPPKRPTLPSSLNPQFVSNAPISYDFISPSTGWASLIVGSASSQEGQLRVFRTVDGAKHWQQQISSSISAINAFPGFGFGPIAVQFFAKTRGFMTIGGPVEKLYQTADGGAHWAPISLPPSTGIENVAFSDVSHGLVLAASYSPSDMPLTANTEPPHLYSTRDGGTSWERLVEPPVDAFGLGFRRPNEAWIGGSGPGPPHFYITSDLGQSWQRHDLPAPLSGQRTDDRYFQNFPTYIELLPDAGAIATVQAFTCLFASPAPGTPSCPNAISNTFVFSSSDGGMTWRRIGPPSGVIYQDSVHWWATTGDALITTADAGQSWRLVGPIPAGGQFEAFGILDSQHAWASLFLSGVHGLALTSDGGLHWTLAKVP